MLMDWIIHAGRIETAVAFSLGSGFIILAGFALAAICHHAFVVVSGRIRRTKHVRSLGTDMPLQHPNCRCEPEGTYMFKQLRQISARPGACESITFRWDDKWDDGRSAIDDMLDAVEESDGGDVRW